jgi:hypothetical protein
MSANTSTATRVVMGIWATFSWRLRCVQATHQGYHTSGFSNGTHTQVCISRYNSAVECTRVAQYSVCDEGYFCVRGKRYACAPGRYGAARGVYSPDCSGPCSAGYYCPEYASTSPTMCECGEPQSFCPQGSATPLRVEEGYYSIGGTLKTRSAERKCEPGSW